MTTTTTTTISSNWMTTLSYSSCWFAFFQFLTWIFQQCSPRIWPTTYSKLTTPGQQAYWYCSIVSSVHAIMITISSFLCGYQGGFFTNDDLFQASTCSTTCLSMFCGYIVSDFVWLYFYRHDWPGSSAMILHHIIAFLSYADLNAQHIGHNLVLMCLLLEVTTPFVNCRWFLSQLGQKDSSLYIVNGLIMTVSWLLMRVMLGAYIGLSIWRMRNQMEDLPWFSKWISLIGIYIIGYSLQCFWFLKIAQGAMKVLVSPKRSTKKE